MNIQLRIGIELLESLVRVPSFEADIEHAGLVDAAFTLIADSFKNGEIFFAEGAFPHRGLNRIEKFENFGFCDCGVRVLFGKRFCYLGWRACAITQHEELILKFTITVVGIRFVVLDDVAFFAVHGLFADAKIRAELRAAQSFGKDARNLNTGGAKSHRWRCLRFRS